MSKELTPLEALNNIKSLFIGTPINLIQQFEIIETALKSLETKEKKIVGTITLDKSLEKFILDSCPNVKNQLKAFEILKNRFDFRVLDDGKNYFLEVGYLWGKKWAFTGRRIPNRKELAICKKALGIKKSHKKKFSKSRGVYYECSPIYEECLKLKKVLDSIKPFIKLEIDNPLEYITIYYLVIGDKECEISKELFDLLKEILE